MPSAHDRFAAAGDLRLMSDPAGLADCDVLCAFHDAPIDAATMDAAPKCRVIVHNGSAILCDLDAATARGIVVLHVPGHNARSVAEHTMGLLLDVWKGLTRSDRHVRSGRPWGLADPGLLTNEISGKCLGLVGFGHVGRYMSRRWRGTASAWRCRRGPGMKGPSATQASAGRPSSISSSTSSDAVSLHLALNEGTQRRHRRRRASPA